MTAVAPPDSAAVLGAGTIGLPAAAWLAAHGTAVTLVTRRPQAVDTLAASAAGRLERLRALGALSGEEAAAGRENLRVSVGLPRGERFALVLEATVEDHDAKLEVLVAAESALAADGMLATTTSSLSIERLAAALRQPERFAAWHWFHPADLMDLVEIVPATATVPEVTEALVDWSLALGKRPIVLSRDTPGFVANRLQYALLREAYALVEAGICGLEEVDTAVTAGLGARWAAIGPFATMDLAGLGVHAAVTEGLFPSLANTQTVPQTLARLRADGAGGAQDGHGLLGRYEPGRSQALEALRDRTLVRLHRGEG